MKVSVRNVFPEYVVEADAAVEVKHETEPEVASEDSIKKIGAPLTVSVCRRHVKQPWGTRPGEFGIGQQSNCRVNPNT